MSKSKPPFNPLDAKSIDFEQLEDFGTSKDESSSEEAEEEHEVEDTSIDLAEDEALDEMDERGGKRVGFADETKSKLDELKVPDKDLQILRQKKKKRVKPKRTVLNTYRIWSVHPFDASIVEALVKKVFSLYLKEERPYPRLPRKAYKKALQVSTKIRDAIKKLKFERFKTVVLVDLIEKPEVSETDHFHTTPSYVSGYRTINDIKQDRIVPAIWENKYFVCSCIVFGFYVE
ncbi:hypothetical protein M8J76_011723 [Diaphorina citri]|nr:hypothetical protein M8J75_003163 [Diaphorina citri]KAI5741245.1 hypothetical protein M8J76_011723 [Diaphorina citri]